MNGQKYNPLNARRVEYQLPKREILIASAVGGFLAMLAIIAGEADIPLLGLAGTFVWVISMFAHEVGHAAFGWLFGVPSVPVPMFTLMLEKSYLAQIIVLIILSFVAYRFWLKKKTEAFYALCTLIVVSVILSFTPYYVHIISYMGHGGSIIIGALFMYYTLTRGEKYGSLKCGLYMFLGAAIILENIVFSYNLMSDPKFLAEYSGPAVFVGHNDFAKIANSTSLSLKSVALLTIINGIIAFVAAICWAIIPHESESKRL